jgi:hypothetical protein
MCQENLRESAGIKQMNIRIRAALKRRLLLWLGYQVPKQESLWREENPGLQLEAVHPYLNSTSVQIVDPRNHRKKGHFFEQRDFYEVKNVILEPIQGLLYTNAGSFIRQSSVWRIHEVYASFPISSRRKKIKSVDSEYYIHIPSNAFYHWLIEDLPSVIALLEKYPEAKLLCYAHPPRFVQDFIATQGRDVAYLKDLTIVPNLLIANKNNDCGWPHPLEMQILQKFVSTFSLESKATSSDKIYISRRSARRSPKNEQDICELFRDFGFNVIELEKLNLLEQIKMFQTAKVLAGIHGAGLSHMIWMTEDSVVIDIANENYWTECFHRLANTQKHLYIPLVYEGSVESEIDLDLLRDGILEGLAASEKKKMR